ncbi:hypothetical protein RW1_019_00410 [Rhodococcus wratislaviensis NBRC 100605]|uniref:CN hydrolase domain-containing protein n=1 Tax=Rhodococcus wratislaviensis NBRC 100605 TaxID=1219028 RepID=X0PR00_RHOWR|nr:hypothetical protein RW1_019_00410 [Rhodococcus wratislaviensis NBRC 100605]
MFTPADDGRVRNTLPVTGIGLATCYDIRFPGLFQTLADRGASLNVVAASWGAGPGKVDQWTLLARARALDSTTTFVAACDQADPTASGEKIHGTAPLGVGHGIVLAHGRCSGTTRFRPGNPHRRHRYGSRHTGSHDPSGTGEQAALTTAARTLPGMAFMSQAISHGMLPWLAS